MAREAVKKQKAKNEKVLSNLRKVIFGVTGFYAVVRFLIMYSSLGFWSIVLFGFFTGIYFFCESQLRSAATCTYEPNGDLLSAGQDISVGWWEYLYDIIYITMAVQIGSLYSSRFYWLFLTIPLYALWASRSMFGMMKQFAPQQQEADDGGYGKGKKSASAGDRNARFLAGRKK